VANTALGVTPRAGRTRPSRNEPCQPVVLRADAGYRLEPRDGATAIDDEYGRPALHTVDQRAEVVLRFGDTGFLHSARIAILERLFKPRSLRWCPLARTICLSGVSACDQNKSVTAGSAVSCGAVWVAR